MRTERRKGKVLGSGLGTVVWVCDIVVDGCRSGRVLVLGQAACFCLSGQMGEWDCLCAYNNAECIFGRGKKRDEESPSHVMCNIT